MGGIVTAKPALPPFLSAAAQVTSWPLVFTRVSVYLEPGEQALLSKSYEEREIKTGSRVFMDFQGIRELPEVLGLDLRGV